MIDYDSAEVQHNRKAVVLETKEQITKHWPAGVVDADNSVWLTTQLAG